MPRRRLVVAIVAVVLLVVAAVTVSLVRRGGAPAGTGDTFTIAVMPDTQAETSDGSARSKERADWLVAQRSALDLRFVAQVGDLTNWGWLDPKQFQVSDAAMRILDTAGIPYAIAIGNHDTQAVGWTSSGGPGGDAYVKNPECRPRFGDHCDTKWLVRQTGDFSASFPPTRFAGFQGGFEPGRSDNIYSTFSAGGRDWLVLTLELWPRKEVVAWARQVIESHPDHQVIILTHHYLLADSTVGPRNGGYGDSSPQYLHDQLVTAFPNVKLVLSGHNGTYGERAEDGPDGTVGAYLQCDDKQTTKVPVRIVTVDVAAGTMTSYVYDIRSGVRSDESTFTGFRF